MQNPTWWGTGPNYNSTQALPYVKAVARDIKLFQLQCGLPRVVGGVRSACGRVTGPQVPVSYAVLDGPTRVDTVRFLNCGQWVEQVPSVCMLAVI
jgi:hypothetical protein